MPLKNLTRSYSVSVSDSVSEDKCKETNSGGAQHQLGIRWILLQIKNIPSMHQLVSDKVAGAVNKINMEV
jgi:hypothetical protein